MPRRSKLGELSEANRQLIVELYEKYHLSRDELPYTPEFDDFHTRFCGQSGLQLTKHEFWRVLSGVGKLAQLPRKTR